ncbi:hypothetical protein [Hymenobacter negativus]|uniref:T9SS type A sorting domain-containing protein n=1 Tax=Hymenobacter negativus TaxID=2795026 RepID=A0ABS0Q7D5_9BACT|nr:hypothetical protein [Hymenobacter negativus]MBH8558161.1 hypothetical protein [Hymenobacter negativus]
MRPFFLSRSLAIIVCLLGTFSAARASHIRGAELTYEYAGTAANPNQYYVTARLFQDLNSPVMDGQMELTCGKNGCAATLPGSFTTYLMRTGGVVAPRACANSEFPFQVTTLAGLVQLPPARWTLSINCTNRTDGVANIAQSMQMSTYVQALLDNTTGLTNSSPRFTTAQLLHLTSTQPQRYSLSAFDSEGDSLAYQLVQPLANPTTAAPCAQLTVGAIAPHFQINATTGELLTVAGPTQQGFYALAARVDEYRRVGGAWQQIGSITRDMTYLVSVGTNQVPAFTRVALASNPSGQLLGQTIRVNPGQTLVLALTATDPDAGQTLTLGSTVPGIVPGTTFQDLGNGQGQLTWQVPATLPLGHYVLPVTANDNACPAPGFGVVTVPVLVTQQVLATRSRQALAQPPFPMPFQAEVRFQLTGQGRQTVLITDEMGRTVAQLASAADGSVVWRPATSVAAGLYLARNLSGTQVAHLSYNGR